MNNSNDSNKNIKVTLPFGGTAKTFTTYIFNSLPFKENNKEYIIVIHPKTRNSRKVRWYSDAAHDNMMSCTEKPFLGKIFGFPSRKTKNTDKVFFVEEVNLTFDEIHYLENQSSARFGVFFGGSWYCSKKEEKRIDFPKSILEKGRLISWDELLNEVLTNFNNKNFDKNAKYPNRWLDERYH